MKEFSPAAERNKSFIHDVLKDYLPHGARVLEVASGTGQHAAYICEQRSDIVWQPTDVQWTALQSVQAYRLEAELHSLLEPVRFDVLEDKPEAVVPPYDLIVNINMIHISPWKACLSLLNWASELLKKDGYLYFYGPFLQDDRPTAPSNLDFDRSLKERNAEWGIRRLEDVVAEAGKRHFQLVKVLPMPANNLSVVFQYSGPVKD